ncbi:MAG: hypothetical protein H7201_17225 [Candidatus Saccharibacteria bacterium]|nr:hypothetical protein [Microbacteriaceae bacterium]
MDRSDQSFRKPDDDRAMFPAIAGASFRPLVGRFDRPEAERRAESAR